MLNLWVVVGRTVRAELRYTKEGTPVLSGRIAVDRPMSAQAKDSARQAGEPTADFFDFVWFGKGAEAVGPHVSKGRLVALTGAGRNRTWTGKDGQPRTQTEIFVRDLQLLPDGRGNGAQGGEAGGKETGGLRAEDSLF